MLRRLQVRIPSQHRMSEIRRPTTILFKSSSPLSKVIKRTFSQEASLGIRIPPKPVLKTYFEELGITLL